MLTLLNNQLILPNRKSLAVRVIQLVDLLYKNTCKAWIRDPSRDSLHPQTNRINRDLPPNYWHADCLQYPCIYTWLRWRACRWVGRHWSTGDRGEQESASEVAKLQHWCTPNRSAGCVSLRRIKRLFRPLFSLLQQWWTKTSRFLNGEMICNSERMFVKECVNTRKEKKTVQRHDHDVTSYGFRTSTTLGASNGSNLPQSQWPRSNILAGHTYHLNTVIKPSGSDHQNNALWCPPSNSRNLDFPLPTSGMSDLFPVSLDLVPWRRETICHNSCICSRGTTSSLTPLSIKIGIDRGIRGIFEAESHFWWQRNERGLRRGRTLGTRRGRFVNVFSRISAVICSLRL